MEDQAPEKESVEWKARVPQDWASVKEAWKLVQANLLNRPFSQEEIDQVLRENPWIRIVLESLELTPMAFFSTIPSWFYGRDLVWKKFFTWDESFSEIENEIFEKRNKKYSKLVLTCWITNLWYSKILFR